MPVFVALRGTPSCFAKVEQGDVRVSWPDNVKQPANSIWCPPAILFTFTHDLFPLPLPPLSLPPPPPSPLPSNRLSRLSSNALGTPVRPVGNLRHMCQWISSVPSPASSPPAPLPPSPSRLHPLPFPPPTPRRPPTPPVPHPQPVTVLFYPLPPC